jgi:tetratricopeptide (TPR) repeat protein
MVSNVKYKAQVMPKNTYDLVFDFIRANSSDKANQLPQFIEKAIGTSINDKAILNRIGFKQISEKKDTDWGIALLKLNLNIFPDDGNLWDSLGEGYYLLNDEENAIESFKKAIELKPETDCYWCENSTKRLQELINK